MIEARTRTVYFSPAAGKHFMTKRAAFHAEAMNRLKEKDRHDPEVYGDDRSYFSNEQWDHFKKVSSRYYRRFGKVRRPPAQLYAPIQETRR